MYSRLKKNEGFTIIEVMIVLAIAALILIIVLLAVPALQRNSKNTTSKNDASTIAGAIGEYESNNKGAIPTGGSQASTGAAVQITGGTPATATVAANTKVAFTVAPAAAPTTDNTAGQILVLIGYDCPTITGGTISTPTADTTAVAVIYPVQTSGTASQAGGCIQS